MPFYNSIQDVAYAVNNSVKLRTTPSTVSKDNVIKTLDKHSYVEKIKSQKQWVKVRYYEDDKEIEGWVYRTKLTKLD